MLNSEFVFGRIFERPREASEHRNHGLALIKHIISKTGLCRSRYRFWALLGAQIMPKGGPK